MLLYRPSQLPPPPFQCSSASRKFLNCKRSRRFPTIRDRFSALQRAENSSILLSAAARRLSTRFQCSSASRKFLNSGYGYRHLIRRRFQCSSASRKFLNAARWNELADEAEVSVLFSEPKIPQLKWVRKPQRLTHPFQCSSASRKFLNRCALLAVGGMR